MYYKKAVMSFPEKRVGGGGGGCLFMRAFGSFRQANEGGIAKGRKNRTVRPTTPLGDWGGKGRLLK